jgi:hypothetical protein
MGISAHVEFVERVRYNHQNSKNSLQRKLNRGDLWYVVCQKEQVRRFPSPSLLSIVQGYNLYTRIEIALIKVSSKITKQESKSI